MNNLKTLIIISCTLNLLLSCIGQEARMGNSLINEPAKPNIEPGSPVLAPGLSTNLKCDEVNILKPLGFNDPYAGCLWHIINREQRIARFNLSGDIVSYFDNIGKSGADLNISGYALDKYSGNGVRIHIPDDGLEIDHEDFKENYDQINSKSCDAFGEDPTERVGSHGIRVSGVIGARGKNGIGLTGIAYEGSISGYNAFACNNFIYAINSPNTHIWSASYGIPSCRSHTRQDRTYSDAYFQGAEVHKLLYLKSAGNDRRESSRCLGGFGDANRDPSNTHPYVFNIAALDNEGNVTSYSSPGSNLFVAAPAGYGGSSKSPGVCTIAANNSYTCSMNGTSVSTPNVAGSIALIKEANTNLSPIDLMTIVAKTSRPIQEAETSKTFLNRTLNITGMNYINRSTNSAGYTHSYNAGFGLPDIDRAVRMAESYTAYKDKLEDYGKTLKSGKTNTVIPPWSCVSKSIEVENSFQVFLNRVSLDASGSTRSYVVFQTAPDGTQSQIVRDSAIDGGGYSHDQKFKSFAAFGIDAKGTWNYDVCNNSHETINVKSVELELWGFTSMGSIQ